MTRVVRLVPPVGFEPTIFGLKVRCRDQLGYGGTADPNELRALNETAEQQTA
jgi:hypothetical protein